MAFDDNNDANYVDGYRYDISIMVPCSLSCSNCSSALWESNSVERKVTRRSQFMSSQRCLYHHKQGLVCQARQ